MAQASPDPQGVARQPDAAVPTSSAQEPPAHAQQRAWGWIAAYLLVALIAIGLGIVAHNQSISPGDLEITRAVQTITNPAVFDLLYAVSSIGYAVPASIIIVVVLLILALLRRWIEALFVALTIPEDVVATGVKSLVARPRPSAALVHVTTHLTDPSFPSGHAVHFTVFYGFLAFMLAIAFRPSGWRNALIVVCIALIALVGVSRVYLGEHWTSDVIGGYLIGALYLAPLCVAYRWAHARALARRQVALALPIAQATPTTPSVDAAARPSSTQPNSHS